MAEVVGGDKMDDVLAHIRHAINTATGVRVGFLDGASYPNGELNVPTVAAINNFGAPGAGIPARPFFSNMVEQESPKWAKRFASVLKSVDYNTDKAMHLMGVDIADQLRESIIHTEEPANSPVTNLLKSRFPQGGQTFADVLQARYDVANGITAPPGKPLVQSGHLLQSVDFEVEE